MAGRTTAGCLAVLLTSAPALAAAPSLTFVPPTDGQPIGRNVPVGVRADGEATSATIHYRVVGAASFDSASMFALDHGFFSGVIPSNAVTAAGVELYVEVADGASPPNVSTAPAAGATAPATFTVTAEDEASPQLIFVPIEDDQPEDLPVAIFAYAVDASSVAELAVHYRAPEEGFAKTVLFQLGGGLFGGEIPASAVVPPIVEYYLEAQDARLSPNRRAFPTAGAAEPLAFTVGQPGAPTIAHVAPSAPVDARRAARIEATVEDDRAVTEAWIFYRRPGETAFSRSVPLIATGAGATYAGTIPAADVLPDAVDYYLEASDAEGHVVRSPEDAPRSAHRLVVVDPTPGDALPPEITHVPIADGQMWRTAVRVEAEARDASGVFAMRVAVSLAGSSTVTSLSMVREHGDHFAVDIPTNLVRGTAVEYYLVAIDASASANVATSPAQAPNEKYVFTVVGDPNVPPEDEPIPDLYSGNGCGCHTAPLRRGSASMFAFALLALVTIVRRVGSRFA